VSKSPTALARSDLLSELAAEQLPPRRPRQNPRAVKRKMSNYKLKPGQPTPLTDSAPKPAPPVVRILSP
jgi:hypothetical protein